MKCAFTVTLRCEVDLGEYRLGELVDDENEFSFSILFDISSVYALDLFFRNDLEDAMFSNVNTGIFVKKGDYQITVVTDLNFLVMIT